MLAISMFEKLTISDVYSLLIV